MERELLPCPFCGGKATLTITGNVHSTRKCVVKCEGCRYQRTDAALRYGDDWLRATAIAAWNRRTTTAKDANLAPLQAEIERLRAEVERLGRHSERMLHAYQRANDRGKRHKARAGRLAEALDIIARVGKASRKQTTRTRWIVASAISALDGNEDWQVLPKPKGFHNAILPAAAQPTKGEGE